MITKETFNHIERVCGKNFTYEDVPAYLRREAERAFDADILKHDIGEQIRTEIALDQEDDAREVGE